MSRVGSSAIVIPADVTLSQDGDDVVIKGKHGELSARFIMMLSCRCGRQYHHLDAAAENKVGALAVGYHSVHPSTIWLLVLALVLLASWTLTVLAIVLRCRATSLS